MTARKQANPLPNFSKDDTATIVAKNTGTTKAPTTNTALADKLKSIGVTVPTKTTTTNYIPSSFTPTKTTTAPVYGPPAPTKAPVQGPKQTSNYIPSSFPAPAKSTTSTPQAYGPPKPSAPSTDPLMNALQRWQNSQPTLPKPYAPPQLNLSAYPQPTIGLSSPRPNTGVAPVTASQPFMPTATTTIQPYTPMVNQPPAPKVQGPDMTMNVSNAWRSAQPVIDKFAPKPAADGSTWFTREFDPIKMLEGMGSTGNPTLDYVKQGIVDRGKAENAQGADLTFGQKAWDTVKTLGDVMGAAGKAFFDQPLPVGQDMKMGANIPGLYPSQNTNKYADLPMSAYVNAPIAGITNTYKQPADKPQSFTDPIGTLVQSYYKSKENIGRLLTAGQASLDAAVRQQDYIDSLPPEKRAEARMSNVLIAGSGAANAQEAAYTIANKDAIIYDLQTRANISKASYQTRMEQADSLEMQGRPEEAAAMRSMANNDALSAARLFNKSTELQRQSSSDIIESKMSAAGEVVFGMFADPFFGFNGVADQVAHAIKVGKEVAAVEKITNLRPEEVVSMATKALGEVVTPKAAPSIAKTFTRYLFSSTPETIVARTTAVSDTLIKSVLEQTRNVGEVKTVLKAVLDGSAAKGVQLADRVVTLPNNILANPDVLKNLPKLKALEKPIYEAIAEQSTKLFNPLEIRAVLDDVVFKGARELEGLGKVATLPEGAVKFTPRLTEAGTTVVDYLNKAGKVISSSPEMLPYDAQVFMKNLKAAGEGAAASMSFNPLKTAANIQRGIMSEMFLNMSPRHWIKNAAAGYGMAAMTGNLKEIRPIGKMVDFLAKKGEGMLPRMIAEAMTEGNAPLAEEIGKSAFTFGGRWTKNNPLAAASALGTKVWQSPYSPLGENFIRTTIYTNSFEQFFNPLWTRQVSKAADNMVALGFDPDVVSKLYHLATETGIQGGARDVATTLRGAVNSATIPNTIKEFVPQAERLAPEVYGDIKTVMQAATPENKEVIREALGKVLAENEDRLGSIIAEAPPMPGRDKFTVTSALQDVKEYTQAALNAAQKAGDDIGVAKATIEQLFTKKTEIENTALDAIRNEMANNPNAFNAGMDFLQDMHQAMDKYRGAIGTEGRIAAEANNSAAWQRYGRVVKEEVEKYTAALQKATDDTRLLMGKAAAGEVIPSRYDGWDLLESYYKYDEAANAAQRATVLGSPGKEAYAGTWQPTIDAWRAYVDHSRDEAIQMFRQFPTQESFDIYAGALKDNLSEAIRVRALIAAKKAELEAGKISQNAYHAYRNTAWATSSDHAYIRFYTARVEMATSALAEQAGEALTWTEEGTQATYKLVRPLEGGKWAVRDLETGEIVEAYGKAFKAGPNAVAEPWGQVPSDVIDNYEALVTRAEQTVNDMVDSVKIERTPITAQEAQGVAIPQKTTNPTAPVAGVESGASGEVITMNDIAALANDAGINTASETGVFNRNYLMNVVNKDRKLAGLPPVKWQQLVDDPAIRSETADLLRSRAGGAPIPPRGVTPEDLAAFRDANPTAPNPALTADPELADAFGTGSENVKDVILKANEGVEQAGVNQSPSIGSKAAYDHEQVVSVIDSLMKNYEGIVTPRANTLTDAQKLKAIEFIDNLTNGFREVAAGANDVAEKAVAQTMLNYGERRNFDALFAWTFGYHYFWSRMPLNFIKTVAEKPSILNAYFQSQQAVTRENRDSGADRLLRLKGTLPNPIAPLLPASMQEQYARIGGNPIYWLYPFNFENDYINPDDANNPIERGLMQAEQYLPGALPAWQAAQAAAFDYTNPLGGGEKRTDNIQLQNYIPALKIINDYKQAVTGKLGERGFFGGQDKFDLGRVGESLAIMVAEGKVDKISAGYAMQALQDIQTGKTSALPEMARHPEVAGIVATAISRSGWNQANTQTTSFLTALPTYQEPKAEIALRNAAAERSTLGYGPQNPLGSEAAQTALDQQPSVPGSSNSLIDALGIWWGRTGLYQAQPTPGQPSPGATTAFSEMLKEKADLKKQLGRKLTNSEHKAIEDKYPSAQAYNSQDPTKGKTPQERKDYYAEQARIKLPEIEKRIAREQITTRQGEEAAKLYDEYLKLPAGKPREDYQAAHPDVQIAKMAAYNPQIYDDLTKQFGETAWKAIYDPTRPKFPDVANPTKEQLTAYGKELGAWYDAHPGYDEVDLWAKGRSAWWNSNSSTEGLSMTYDYGRDYQQAVAKFGPDIFQIAANIPEEKGKKGAYYRAHAPYLDAYMTWKNQLKALPESINDLPTINWPAAQNVDQTPNASYLPGKAPVATTPIPGMIPPDLGDAQAYADASGYASKGGGGGGGRRGGGGGRRSGGGGGGGGGYSSGFRWGTPIDPRYLQGSLWPDPNYIERWRPQNADTSWLQAGRQLAPGAPTPWRPISWKA